MVLIFNDAKTYYSIYVDIMSKYPDFNYLEVNDGIKKNIYSFEIYKNLSSLDNNFFNKLKVIYFWSEDSMILPTSYNTRQCRLLPSIIFTPNDPRELKSIGKFLLYHEVAHATSGHKLFHFISRTNLLSLFIIPLGYIIIGVPIDLKFIHLTLGLMLPYASYTIGNWFDPENYNEYYADFMGILLLNGKVSNEELEKAIDFLKQRGNNVLFRENLATLSKILKQSSNTLKDERVDSLIKYILEDKRPKIYHKLFLIFVLSRYLNYVASHSAFNTFHFTLLIIGLSTVIIILFLWAIGSEYNFNKFILERMPNK